MKRTIVVTAALLASALSAHAAPVKKHLRVVNGRACHKIVVTKDNAVSYALGIASGKIPLPQMDELRRCYPRIRQYREWDYHYVWLDLPDAGRKAAVQFARSCLKQKYSLRNFLLLAATIALGDRVRMPDSGHGCVSLVARALQEAGIRFDRKPTDMTPADLAKRFGVTP